MPPATSHRTEPLTFELEHFAFAGDDRLEVTGRWHGVAGRRFVRPTLHLDVEGHHRRLLAVLDHKPWAPDDDHWTAAFAWRGAKQGISSVRLELAPDIVLELPPPGRAQPGTSIHPRPRKPTAAPPARPAAKNRPPARAAESMPPATESAPPAPASMAAPPARPAAEKPAPGAAAPRPAAARPAPRDDARPVPAPEAKLKILALERELEEERSQREHLAADLQAAQRQLERQAEHQAGAVAKAEELVRVEGERDQLAQRLEEALAQPEQIVVEPLAPRRAGPRVRSDWTPAQRAAGDRDAVRRDPRCVGTADRGFLNLCKAAISPAPWV